MNINKKNISKNISKKSQVSNIEGSQILESFISLIQTNTKLKVLKLSGFGSFQTRITPERLGRNPKTKESYIISSRNKLSFKASNKIKEILN
tara:strand:+ start:1441 stop:1716 length:276 start_codon:yes stop_codon:yes gene_type:complete